MSLKFTTSHTWTGPIESWSKNDSGNRLFSQSFSVEEMSGLPIDINFSASLCSRLVTLQAKNVLGDNAFIFNFRATEGGEMLEDYMIRLEYLSEIENWTNYKDMSPIIQTPKITSELARKGLELRVAFGGTVIDFWNQLEHLQRGM